MVSEDSRAGGKIPRSAVLVSVRNATELELVFDHGVSWIDLKEPRHGSLGCPNECEIAIFVAEFRDLVARGRADIRDTPPQISLAMGDLDDQEHLPISPSLLGEFAMVKVGMRDQSGSLSARLRAWQAASGVSDRFVLVFYPDLCNDSHQQWVSFLELGKSHGINKVLIDTLHKNGNSTLDYYQPQLLQQLIVQASEQGIQTMVAGTLSLTQLETVWSCGAKIIGIRSAVCQGNSRLQSLDPDRLQELADMWFQGHS